MLGRPRKIVDWERRRELEHGQVNLGVGACSRRSNPAFTAPRANVDGAVRAVLGGEDRGGCERDALTSAAAVPEHEPHFDHGSGKTRWQLSWTCGVGDARAG